MKRLIDDGGVPFCEWRYWPLIPATVALKANSPMRKQSESKSDIIILAVY
jgi:hypothetical protein